MNNAPAQPDRLFFAVRLPHDAASQAADLCRRLRAQHSLSGSEVRADRLHITLHWLGDYQGLPPDIVASALMAGGLVKVPPFDVVMNRVQSYLDGGLVLSGSNVAPLRDFQKRLGDAMDSTGIGRLKRTTFKPHVTLLYNNHPIEHTPVTPIWWTVHDFVLIHSLQGQSRHIILGDWQLPERQIRLVGI